MLHASRLAAAKGLLLDCFRQLARERAQAALIRFGGGGAELLFGPAVPRWWNERWIEPIGGGGGTPLARGVAAAQRLLEQARRRDPVRTRVLWVLTDGRTREQPPRPPSADHILIVDCETGRARLDGCMWLARLWQAQCVPLGALASEA